MIKTINFIFYFRGETNPMQFIPATQTANDFAHLADFTYAGMGVSVFNIDARPRLNTLSGVVTIVRNVAGAIFNEVILGCESGAFDDRASRSQKIFSFIERHIQIDGLEQSPVYKSVAEIAQHNVARMLPLLHMKNDV